MGNGLTVDSLKVQQANYLKELGDINQLTPEQKAKFDEILKKYYTPKKDADTTYVTDKNGRLREGQVVTKEPQTFLDRIQRKPEKDLAKVKKAQVQKFLQNIAALGLDLKIEDIMTKNGTLNPNFKVDEKGNISFRNVKAFLNDKAPKYFETNNGEWAMETSAKFLPSISLIKDLPDGFKIDKPDRDKLVRILPYYPDKDKVVVEPKPYYLEQDNVELKYL